jgi:2-octaprenyl-6-methoxyphenol hydroxylase
MASISNKSTRRVELAVVGGGLIGTSLAIACAQAGIEVALIDRIDPKAMLKAGFDGRTTALSFGTRRVMAGIGVWDDLAGEAQPILEIRVADGASPFFLHYDHQALGDDPLGFIVENAHLRRVLLARAQALDSLTIVAPATVARVSDAGASALVELDDSSTLQAQLVAACDGRHSALRQAAGIETLSWSYRQTALVAVIAHERPHGGVAVEHFRPAGPFAILPMTGNRSSIVWTERSELAPKLLKLGKQEFHAELTRRFGDFLGALEVAGPVFSYPLSFTHAKRYTAPRLALVGDAAHAIHPIAGQGLNLGMRDVASLAEIAVDARRLGLDIGDALLLARYERWRRFDSVALAALTDGLNRLFSNRLPPVALLRDVGLAAVNAAPPLKRYLMRHAMGIVGDLPRLVKGEAL